MSQEVCVCVWWSYLDKHVLMSEDEGVVEEWSERGIKDIMCRVRMNRVVEFCMGTWEGVREEGEREGGNKGGRKRGMEGKRGKRKERQGGEGGRKRETAKVDSGLPSYRPLTVDGSFKVDSSGVLKGDVHHPPVVPPFSDVLRQ